MSIKPQQDVIRQKAEELLAQQDELEVTTLAEARALIKELRIREIEAELRHTASTRVVLPEQQADEGSVASGGCKMLHLLPDGTLAAGTIVAESITGYGATELVGHPIIAFVHPDDHGKIAALIEHAQMIPAEGHKVDFRWRGKDGVYLRLTCMAYAIRGPETTTVDRLVLVSHHVMTRRQGIEQRVLAKRLEMAVKATGVGIWEWDVTGRTPIHFDERMYAIYGLEPGEFDGKSETLMEVFHPEDRDIVAGLMRTSLDTQKPLLGEFRVIWKDGTVRYVESAGVTVFDETGEPLRVIGSIIDVTQRVEQYHRIADQYQLLRTLVDALPQVVITFDTNRRLSSVNARGCELLGMETPESVLGRTLSELAQEGTLLPIQRAIELDARVRDVLTTGEAQIDNELHLGPPEFLREIWLLSSRLPLYSARQELVGVKVIIQDITELKTREALLRDSQQRLALATQVGNIGVWEYDPVTETEIWDDVTLDLYGVSREDFTGTFEDWSRRVHPDDLAATLAVMEALEQEGGTASYNFRIVRPNGEVRYLHGNSGRIEDAQGNVIRILGVNVDITEQMLTQLVLERTLAEEKQLGELKSRFVAMASHEFRTPLAGILAAAESIARYRERMTDEQIEDRLVKIRQRVFFMREMLEDVLVLARMQEGRLEFSPHELDLVSLCRDAINYAGDLGIASGRIDLRTSAEAIVVWGDERLLSQVLNNLIVNALRYSPNDAPVSVELDHGDDTVRVTVRDSGIGIPEEDIGRLFDPFHRGRNIGERSGTGLGLTIVRYAVDIHGGTIEVQSTVGVGTTIHVTLPRCSQSGSGVSEAQP